MLIICVMHAVDAAHYANFSPINGTFQNYNPVRRLIDGQTPYRDFQDYLGLGHLYFGTLFTVLFGGTYRSSLAAFSFLTFGGLAITSFVMGLAILKKKELAAAATNIVLMVLTIKPLFFENWLAGTGEILDALNYALDTGNSARFVRGMILPLLILVLWIGYIGINGIKNMRISKYREVIIFSGIGLFSGASFVWSNDYGISCWFCMIIMAFWISFSRSRVILKAVINAFFELVGSAIGIVIAGTLLTCGHLTQWVSSTFGTGGYQGWYYNSPKSYYLYDVDFSYIMLIQAGICIFYMIKIFKNKGNIVSLRRYAIPGLANMVSFCAVNEYHLLSGGDSREVALAVLFLTIIFEICSIVQAYKRQEVARFTVIASIIISVAWIISDVKEEVIFKYLTDRDGIYVDALGGNLTFLGDEIIATNYFLDGNDFFATYASAQEVVSGTYQPSGTDYIIHVLGDKQRENYLDTFDIGSFKYAATIKETYTDWEYWVQRANWFFYRKLYEAWHPVYSNTYEVY